jgi:hypothetical protein
MLGMVLQRVKNPNLGMFVLQCLVAYASKSGMIDFVPNFSGIFAYLLIDTLDK